MSDVEFSDGDCAMESVGDDPMLTNGNSDDEMLVTSKSKKAPKRKATTTTAAKAKRAKKTVPATETTSATDSLFVAMNNPNLIIVFPTAEFLDLPYDNEHVRFLVDPPNGLYMGDINAALTSSTFALIKCEVRNNTSRRPQSEQTVLCLNTKSLESLIKLAKQINSMVIMAVFDDVVTVALQNTAGGQFGTCFTMKQLNLQQNNEIGFCLSNCFVCDFLIVMNLRQLQQTIQSIESMCKQTFYELSIYSADTGSEYFFNIKSGDDGASPIEVNFWFKATMTPKKQALDIPDWVPFLTSPELTAERVLSVDMSSDSSTVPIVPNFGTMSCIVSNQFAVSDTMSFMKKSTNKTIGFFLACKEYPDLNAIQVNNDDGAYTRRLLGSRVLDE